MLVTDILRQTCERSPESPAIWHRGEWLSYADLDGRSNQLGHFLRDAGVRAGDRVALLIENSDVYVVALFAAWKAGAVVVPLNTDTTVADLGYLLRDCDARAVVCSARFAGRVTATLPESPTTIVAVLDQPEIADDHAGACALTTLEHACAAHERTSCSVRRIDADLASIVYTSGSTGRPKGVMLTHLNLVSNTRSIVEYLKLGPEDRVLVILPFFYIYGQSLLLTHFLTGGSVVIENRFLYPNVVLETMVEMGVTGFAGVPSTFTILLQRSKLAEREFPKLRYVTQAGGAMAASLQREVAEAIAPAELFIMYGATEAAPRLSYLNPTYLPQKWGSIGRAIPNVDLYVAGPDGAALPPGEPGELVARGSNIFRGYWKDPESTAQVLRDGAYRTGDLGYMDEDGFLYVSGRAREFIKVKGYRVSAQGVEAALQSHHAVGEAAVVGAQDALLGEAIVAFVVPRNGTSLSPDELIDFARQQLPTYKQPSRIVVTDALPKNSSGKVMKSRLKEQLESPTAGKGEVR